MKHGFSSHLLRLYALLCLYGLFELVSVAHAANLKLGMKPQPMAPAIHACVLNNTCPPQGSITITKPQAGNVWSTGSYQLIQWTYNATATRDTDVSLWQNNQKVGEIWTGSATGKTAYIVPFTLAGGLYEIRANLQSDPRVEARQPVSIVPTAVTLATPQAPLVSGTPHVINWTYSGSMSWFKLSVLDASGAVVQSYANVPAGSNGKGSKSWVAPLPPAGKTSADYRFQASASFHTDVTNNNALSEVVLGTSEPFQVRLPGIQVTGRFLVDTGVAECSPGKTYPFSWSSELGGKPVKIELYKAAALLQTVVASQNSGPSNTLPWTAPNIPETLNRNYLTLRVTSLDYPAVHAEVMFSCSRPGIALKAPDPKQDLQMNQAYPIAWDYYGDPGRHVRVELLSAKPGGYDMAVFETPAQDAPMQASSGKWGQGQIAWTLTKRGPHQNFYIQLRSLEDQSVWDRKQFYIAQSGSSGTSYGTVTTGSSTAGSTTKNNCSAGLHVGKLQLTGPTTLKYNSNDAATFHASSIVTLDANCYVLEGQLASDQYLKYRDANSAAAKFYGVSVASFSNGYVQKGQLAGDQVLEYGPSRSVKLRSSSVPSFAGGYLQSGQLAGDQTLQYKSGRSVVIRSSSVASFVDGYLKTGQLLGDTVLDYRANNHASFRSSSLVTFGTDGYVQSGQLAFDTTLEYKSGKSARFAGFPVVFRSGGYVKSGFLSYATTLQKAQGVSENVPALAYVAFDDAGLLVSYNPPGFSACYKCDPAHDPGCSNSGGLPPCK